MRVIGIESSCDETAVAVYDAELGLLSHRLHSQIAMHQAYGGVVPELASRDHVRRLLPLVREVLADANSDRESIDGVAYTAGPGLIGALLVGAGFAASLSLAWASRRWVYIIWRGTYSRPCWSPIRPASRFLHCSCPVVTPRSWTSRPWVSTAFSAKPWTMPPARPS